LAKNGQTYETKYRKEWIYDKAKDKPLGLISIADLETKSIILFRWRLDSRNATTRHFQILCSVWKSALPWLKWYSVCLKKSRGSEFKPPVPPKKPKNKCSFSYCILIGSQDWKSSTKPYLKQTFQPADLCVSHKTQLPRLVF
jgi:hypothetical protein